MTCFLCCITNTITPNTNTISSVIIILIPRFNVDCSLAESHYAKNEGLFAGGSGGGHPIGREDDEDDEDYI